MRAPAAAPVAALVALVLCACQAGSSVPSAPSQPAAPAPAAPAPPPAAVVDVSGTWSGTGSDSFSPELVRWVLTQAGSDVTGTAELAPVDPADGSCASCHKLKKGTFTGTLSGNALSVSMRFPAGGDVPTPICIVDLSGTATVDDRRITASYSGTDTCEGIFSNGRIDLTRQP